LPFVVRYQIDRGSAIRHPGDSHSGDRLWSAATLLYRLLFHLFHLLYQVEIRWLNRHRFAALPVVLSIIGSGGALRAIITLLRFCQYTTHINCATS
jgi:hypothetical protein